MTKCNHAYARYAFWNCDRGQTRALVKRIITNICDAVSDMNTFYGPLPRRIIIREIVHFSAAVNRQEPVAVQRPRKVIAARAGFHDLSRVGGQQKERAKRKDHCRAKEQT
jgi:hypothetical protein